MVEPPEREEGQQPELDRELEIPDGPLSPGSPGSSAEDGASEEEGGYRNMIVPLVVVPAMIVMVAVLIAVLFGMLSGDVRSPAENLERVLNGGANERTQAAFELVRQVLDFETAKTEGREPEWDIDPSFLEDLRRARAGLAEPETEGDLWVPFVLSSLMAQLGDADGVHQLLEMTRLPQKLDPDFRFGQDALFILGAVGDELSDPLKREVGARMIELTRGEDEGVALLAAAALQRLPSAETDAALADLLGARRLDLRLQAALSLAELGSDRGREVLLEALGTEPYERERAGDERRWAAATVSTARLKALRALKSLGVALPAELRAALEADGDPNLRSAVLELTTATATSEAGL